MAVSGINFEHPSQKDVYTYPNMFMKTFQHKFISALVEKFLWGNTSMHNGWRATLLSIVLKNILYNVEMVKRIKWPY